MNPQLRGSAAHVFVESLRDPQLGTADDHHLRRVLRLRFGDTVSIGDGVGGWVLARWTASGLVVESDRLFEPAGSSTSVVAAIPKGDRPEWIVQKLTEIGVTSMGFIECDRSVVRWDAERGRRQTDRFRRIAREAAMQSRRLWLPEVGDVQAFSDLVIDGATAIADPEGAEVTADVSTILIGPEGGFTDAELLRVPRHVSLSANVLRVETAALVAGSILTLRHERN